MAEIANPTSFGEDLVKSIQKAINKMLAQRAKDNLDIVIAGPDGLPQTVSAKELLKNRK